MPTTDPAGTYSGPGASAPTTDPAGTYSLAGASAPIADSGGTYSAAGASAPTQDPAGTYSSPYALDHLFLISDNMAPTSSVLSFQSATAVANYFGVTSSEASLANEFFAGYSGAPATMLISRYSLEGDRPHLFGANVSDLTLSQLQSISGSLSIAFQGYTYSGSINLSGVRVSRRRRAQFRLRSIRACRSRPSRQEVRSRRFRFPSPVPSTGILLQVTSVSSGSIELGAQISGPGIAAGAQIVEQIDGTPGGPGLYTLYAPEGLLRRRL